MTLSDDVTDTIDKKITPIPEKLDIFSTRTSRTMITSLKQADFHVRQNTTICIKLSYLVVRCLKEGINNYYFKMSVDGNH